MFEKEINNPKKEDWIKITALLVHAARIDDNYSEKERLIIINFLKSFDDKINFEEIIRKAESDEENSNQILKYTQEIKKKYNRFQKKNY